MNALETRKPVPVGDEPFGLDADTWFTALDHRIVEVGVGTCIATVLGIHTGPTGLWIQLSCADDSDQTAVLFVDEQTRLEDVLRALRVSPPQGAPLEILDCTPRTPSWIDHAGAERALARRDH